MFDPKDTGYNKSMPQYPGVLGQSSAYTDPSTNINRPMEFQTDPSLTSYGVYRKFFTEEVPAQIGDKNLSFMYQPDGSLFPVGAPFYGYTSFGRRKRKGPKGPKGRKVRRSRKI